MSARDRRDQRNEARASSFTDEQRAFLRGKCAREKGQHERTCPHLKTHAERSAWLRGYHYQDNLRAGLRPLDTARRLP